MKKQNNIETELNKIRTDFYETTKDMSPSERVAYLKAQVAPIHQKFNIRPTSKAIPYNR
ncbi:MAG: hypothetical protein FWH14_06085 [Oscillospiraceae bacterium]|nr:hypothetical protein [Oscillospiraceae bacterium]